MKIRITTLIALMVCSLCFAGTRTVEGTGEGKYYNNVWKSWSTQPISVYVDSQGNFYFSAGGRLLNARGYLKPDQLRPLIDALKKGQEWAKKAKEDQLEVTKELATFMNPTDHDQTGVQLTFFAASKGTQTDIICLVKDFENMFSKVELYLDPTQVPAVIALLERVPATLKELKEQEAKAEALK
jgi:hypothetical protein